MPDLLKVAALLFATAALFAAGPPGAPPTLSPPMGWNSWDSYGLSVTESEFMANAQWLARNVKRHGWQYAVVDEGWYLRNPQAKPDTFAFVLDANGRYIPADNRFPSSISAAGFKPLADRIHSLGLKFGIHILRGIPKKAVANNSPIANSHFSAGDAADSSDVCPWNQDNYGVKASPAGQAYYDSIAQLYAAWGVDFLKVDCIASHPYKPDEIRMLSEALRKTGRAIVLSLSPGPAPIDKAAELARYATMWRISNDVWDHWGVWPQR
ncbi:MAG: alpha-galactosidase, partial [Acidobacteriaceae bacterium]|nr:alpha-galactosidase [Acidobacteriaceae bacterium]